jgi:hypothetical protein
MAASRQDVDRWIATAKEQGAKYILSVCDTFDWDDYPIYCDSLKELQQAINSHNGKNMQRINEVIEIHRDKVIENQSPYNYL